MLIIWLAFIIMFPTISLGSHHGQLIRSRSCPEFGSRKWSLPFRSGSLIIIESRIGENRMEYFYNLELPEVFTDVLTADDQLSDEDKEFLAELIALSEPSEEED